MGIRLLQEGIFYIKRETTVLLQPDAHEQLIGRLTRT